MGAFDWSRTTPDETLQFWFPEDGHSESFESHGAFWKHRMGGGVDQEIRARFADLTEAAARGILDHWAESPRGRLALVITLDQFSWSIWRNEPAAFAQDIYATRLVLEAFRNGHYEALEHVWEKAFCLIAIGHCEGPDHLERADRILELAGDLIAETPDHLSLNYRVVYDQIRLGREVIAAFGRHPHRNKVLERISTLAEEAYLSAGVFPHQRDIPAGRDEVEALVSRG